MLLNLSGIVVMLLLCSMLILVRKKKQRLLKTWTLFALRLLAALLVIVALHPPLLQTQTLLDTHSLIVLDFSESVTEQELTELQQQLSTYIKRPGASKTISLIAFADRAEILHHKLPTQEFIQLLSQSNYLSTQRKKIQTKIQRGSSGLKQAIQLADALYIPQQSAEFLFLSDGRLNQPCPKLSHDIPHFFLQSQHPTQTLDAKITALKLPPSIQQDRPFSIEIALASDTKTSARLDLKIERNETIAWENSSEQQLNLDASKRTFDAIKLPAGHYTLHAKLHNENDSKQSNNYQTLEFNVSGPKTILLVSDSINESKNIRAAIIASSHVTQQITSQEFRANLAQIRDHSFTILTGISPDALDTTEWIKLRKNIEDSGSGLCFVAADTWDTLKHPSTHIINSILPVSLLDHTPAPPEENPVDLDQGPIEDPEPQTGGLTADDDGPIEKEILTPSVALVLLIDRSGSMALDNKIEVAKASAIATAKTMDENDTIAVCAFDAKPHWLFRPTKATNIQYIEDSLRRLRPGGGTVLFPSLKSTYDELQRVHSNLKHVIILSDGQTMEADFEKLITKMVQDKITVSTVFIGDKEGGNRMARIARWGKGNYYSANKLNRIPRIFSHDLKRRINEYKALHKDDAATPSNKKQDPPSTDETANSLPTDPEPDVPALEGNSTPTSPSLPEILSAGRPSLATRTLDFSAAPRIHKWIRSKEKQNSLVSLQTQISKSPILTEWPLGLGRVFFLSTDTYRWGSEIAEWEEFPKLLNQIIMSGYHQTSETDIQFDDHLKQNGKEITLSFLIYDAKGRPILDLKNEITLRKDGQEISKTNALAKGQGYYQTTLRLPDDGQNFTLDLNQFQNEIPLHHKRYHVFSDLDPEQKHRWQTYNTNEIFQKTQAWTPLPEPNTPSPNTATLLSTPYPIAYIFLLLALCLFPLELLIRRFG